jgi:hypothetical protein
LSHQIRNSPRHAKGTDDVIVTSVQVRNTNKMMECEDIYHSRLEDKYFLQSKYMHKLL